MEIPVYKTLGIVLKKADLSDTDRLLAIYTQKRGKILVRAKGIGKKESRLKSLIEPFNIYEFSVAKSRNIDILAGSWPIKEFVCLRQNLENLSLAIYFSELTDKLVSSPERDDKIWALLARVFEVLDKNSNSSSFFEKEERELSAPFLKEGLALKKIKTAFEEKLLEFLGHPSFSAQNIYAWRARQNYLEFLAGERIRAAEFFVSLIG